jgi:hypothetical protein
MLMILGHVYRSFPFAVLLALYFVTTATARRAIPEDNLAYPVLVTLNNGASGSGFYMHTTTALYLVTAKHVLFDPDTGLLRGEEVDPKTHNVTRDAAVELLSYSKDVSDPTPNLLIVDLSAMVKTGDLKAHPSDDVAVIKLGTSVENSNPSPGQGAPISYIPGVTVTSRSTSGPVAVTVETMKRFDQVLTGNEVIVFGYPNSLGLRALGPQQKSQFDSHRPLLRKGIVAGLNLQKRSIILDCPAYQGNSGGPVLEIEADDTNSLMTHFNIIGVVSEFVPYADIWFNTRERYTNTTILNSGYSIGTPMDFVLEIAK